MNSVPLKSITDLKSEHLTAEAEEIIKCIDKTWVKDKYFSYKLERKLETVGVQTFHKDGLNGDYWCARHSTLNELNTGDRIAYCSKLYTYIVGSMESLTDTHTEYEKRYIHELKDFDLKEMTLTANEKYDTFTYLARLYYKFPFPLKQRVFHELVHVCKSKTDSTVFIITLAIDPRCYAEESVNMVKARYTSIEQISFEEATNQLHWIMCTCSNAGGAIPNWLSKRSINAAIAKDVPCFLNWSDSI